MGGWGEGAKGGRAERKEKRVMEKVEEEKRGKKKQGRNIKAASRWHLQGMKLLPKSPLDSTPLDRETGDGRGYFEESDLKQEFSLKKREK